MVRHTPANPGRGRASRGLHPMRERQNDGEILAVYQEMLQEAEARDPAQFHSDRPIKRRRAGDNKAIPVDSQTLSQANTAVDVSEDGAQLVQTVYGTLSSDESDVEWEDVDFQRPSASLLPTTAPTFPGDHETLQITLDQEPEKRKKTVHRRKPISAAERKVRLDVHKAHLLCLLGHVHIRNLWCNDEEVQGFLKRILPKNVRMLLNPPEEKPYYVRSTTFMDGLNQAGDVFNRRFRVTKPGLKRAHWAEDQNQLNLRTKSIMADAEVFLSKEDFRTQAKVLQGSRDFGAQLFCALLRSVAVDARLVCSLQPLPFSGTVKDMTPIKAKSQYIVLSDDNESSTDQNSGNSPTPSRVRRLAQPQFSPARQAQASTRSGPRPILQESSYPVFWVEAFNDAAQKWITVDPMVTKSLAKPSKLEPPARDAYNSMSYVVAFEDDASARDITRRYAKAFNAKTRKLRVESTRRGEEWWQQSMRVYEKPFLEDRDEAEISELTSKSAAEPMPRNIQDFKDHPIYALERHLLRNEVIFPKRVIGHVGLSKTTAKSDTLEPVYRRSDVHVARSADKWYRLGRDVKVGEQPLKHVPARRDKTGFLSDEEEGTEPEETALYAEFQTELYQPPSVVQGKIPKNVYGNLDIYVSSMVPSGAVHIKRPEAARAARILGIDYADAVIGFDFKGRRGTAIVSGIVIALEYQEGLREVLDSIEDERQEAALEARSAEALRFWRLFLVKLRIAERVKGYAAEDEYGASEMSVDATEPAEEAGGGFFPDPDEPTQSPPLRVLGEDKFGEKAPPLEVDSENTMATVSGQEDEALGGGFLIGERMDVSPTMAPAAGSLPPTLRQNKARAPEGSRYQLIIVPSHGSDAPSSPEPKARAFARPASPAEAAVRDDDMKGSSAKLPISVESSAHGGSASSRVEATSRPPSPPRAQDQEGDSEIEKGSLMSEDPEDEDAIPEWLMSD